jgi:DNA-binding NarL/FixJ family response regulator
VKKLRVLMAVQPAALARVVEHLLGDPREVAVVARVEEGRSLPRRAERSSPDVIVANARLLGREIGPAVAAVKDSSPLSKLIVISPFKDLAREARRCGADATLEEETLVRRLPGALKALAGGARTRTRRKGSPL